jgi:hypothetical protein
MRILLCCPIKNRDWILPTYLQRVLDLDYPKELINIYWIINNSTDNSLPMLQQFKNEFSNVYESITIEVCNDTSVPDDTRSVAVRREYTYHWLAKLRNKLVDKTLRLDCDFMFSTDSDILLKPETLYQLMSHDEHIVSSLVYNGYLHVPKGVPKDYSPIENAYRFPNILRFNEEEGIYKHVVSSRTRKPSACPIGHLIPVHFTGACILVSKEACSKARYGYYKYGEDEAFCKSARDSGYNIYCDVSMFNYHIMSPKLLELYLHGLFPSN